MRRALVTVVGPRRRVNLEVPARSPINQLFGGLIERCGEGGPDPRGWTLSHADGRVLPPERSLRDCDVHDGAILYLRPASAPRPTPPSERAPRAQPAAGLRSPVPPSRLTLLGAAASAMLDPRPSPESPLPVGWLETVHGPSRLCRAAAAWRGAERAARLDRAIEAARPRASLTIAVMSPKGGVGKTTVTALLGSLLARVRSERVVAVDANPDYGSLGRALRCDGGIFVDDLLRLWERPGLSPAALDRQLGRGPEGLRVLRAPTEPARMSQLGEDLYRRVVAGLRDLGGLVLLDCATGLRAPTSAMALALADQVVLVTDPDPTAAALVIEAARHLARMPSLRAVVLNRAPASMRGPVVDRLRAAVEPARRLAVIPHDPEAAGRLAAGQFRWAEAPAGWQLGVRELAAALAAGWRPQPA